ncbi:unnamed protein product [Malus baccata var. baccata]
MAESLLGRGWNPALRLCWCAQGRIKAVKARFTHSPSTPLIRTSEFVIADLRIFNLFDGKDPRNDPGCDVGEHIQVFLGIEIGPVFLETAMDRFEWWLGEIERWSMENRTYRDGEEEWWSWWKKADAGDEKLELVEEAKPDADGEIPPLEAV